MVTRKQISVAKVTIFGLFLSFALYYGAISWRSFFYGDDFYFLNRVVHEDLYSLLTKPGMFHFRPISQYLYFTFCHELFGINPLGYYLVNLVLLMVIIGLSIRLFRKLKIDTTASPYISILIFSSPVCYGNLIWISNIQHILYFLLVLAALYCEVLWITERRFRYKLAAVLFYMLALFSNIAAAVFMFLVVLVYLLLGLQAKSKNLFKYLLRIFLNLVPYLLIFILFYLLYRQTPSFSHALLSMNDETSPYYSQYTLKRVVRNLKSFICFVVPFGRVGLYWILTAFVIQLSRIVWAIFKKRSLHPRAVDSTFFFLWFLSSASMFIFMVRRAEAHFLLLGSIGLFYLLIYSVSDFAQWVRCGSRTRSILIVALVILATGIHIFDSVKIIRDPFGVAEKQGIDQINKLISIEMKNKNNFYLLNWKNYCAGIENDRSDPTWRRYGFGSLGEHFFQGRSVEFLVKDYEEVLSDLRSDGGIIYYRDTHDFFLNPPATETLPERRGD